MVGNKVFQAMMQVMPVNTCYFQRKLFYWKHDITKALPTTTSNLTLPHSPPTNLEALSYIISPIPDPKPISSFIFNINNTLWNAKANPRKYKKGPLPPEGIESNTKGEPPQQLEVCEEIKGFGR